ncbi:MAG TPA: TraB/GumN family protein [Candidatus Altiarchaeales archaeon]|nr:TraB/GumN family protein [Candidatus Altiarchaeales archaeon]
MLNEVTKITVGNKEISLVGTAHVSKESIELVRETIDKENPDMVAVELDEQRYEALLSKKKWNETEIHKVIRTGRAYLFLTQLLLTNFQRRIGDKLGVSPGSEMVEAINIGRDRGIEISLVDRDIKITLRRALNIMTLKEKLKLLYALLEGIFEREEIDEEILEKLKKKDMMTEMIEELSRTVPSVKDVLIDERDRYIANKILSLNAKKIVAVVGAGHVDGIKRIIEEKKQENVRGKEIETLEKIPEPRSFLKFLGYLVPIIFFIIIMWGFYSRGFDLTIEMLWKWFLINGTLSAFGVIIALGHPLSVITAFLVAPITSLNPTIAAGWFAGAIEIWIRKPRVKDFDSLFKLNSMRDYWRNRVTRILLVIVFANLGSSIGTFIALPYLGTLV